MIQCLRVANNDLCLCEDSLFVCTCSRDLCVMLDEREGKGGLGEHSRYIERE